MHNNQSDTEKSRLRAVNTLLSPDETRDEALDKFVRLASRVLGISGSFISIIDDNNQYIKASQNFDLKQSTRGDSLCRHVVDGNGELVVEDTLLDDRFVSHPFVTGQPFMRFYAGVSLTNEDGFVLGTLCVTDIEPRVFSDEQLITLKFLSELVTSFLDAWSHAGFVDVITNLPNRQRLVRDIQQLALDNPDQSHKLMLIDCIEIQRAYELARTVGTGPAEQLLKHIAISVFHRLKMNGETTLYAFAPGRFAIVQPSETALQAQDVVNTLSNMNADLGENISIALEVFTGETEFLPGQLSANEALRQAVSALHEGIHTNVTAMPFDTSYDSRRTDDFLIMNDLASALKMDEDLYLVYQPKICLHSGKTVGLEALIRWDHPLRGELFPSQFIPLAKKTNLLSELTDWVINRVIAQLKTWNQEYTLIPVSINASERDFSKPGFADALAAKLQDAQLPASVMGIECLENELVTESRVAVEGLQSLKAHGFDISLDDFGIGYSNISYLQDLPLDVVKIDMSLITRLANDATSRIIVSNIIRMLKELNYTVLAEGVETEATLTLLKQYGCDQVQGYFCSKPIPASDIEHWLAPRAR
ncbi:EAL domain-containing protein [Duffyella gerundensis]|uniref:EAL domain-containing protein n=1 Tax=Duffyella gerundensis TaxID=1619313 RepID=UPI0016545AA2